MERLASLALPVVTPTEVGPEAAVRFVVEEAAEASPLPAGSALTVARDGANHRLTLTLPRAEVEFPCGRKSWVEGLLGQGSGVPRGACGAAASEPTPVVCRGGWTGPDTFEADVVLIETPHRIRLRGEGSRLDASWNVPPLNGARLEQNLPS